jgi:uncharacterized UBP type Zn finger protein
MIRNEIDDFRSQFFEKVIQDEKDKAVALQRKQKTCHHLFNIQEEVRPNGYQYRTCSKCEFTAFKKVAVWEGTKNCTIS